MVLHRNAEKFLRNMRKIPEKYERRKFLRKAPVTHPPATAGDKQTKLKMETLESTEENIIRHAIRCNWEDLQ